MESIKRFENFEEDRYESELELLTDTFIEIEDEFDLTQIESSDDRLGYGNNFKIDEDCYHISYFNSKRNSNGGSIDSLTIYFHIFIRVEDNPLRSDSQSLSSVIKKHPKMYSRLMDWMSSSQNLIKKMGNESVSSLSSSFKTSWSQGDNRRPSGRPLYTHLSIRFEIWDNSHEVERIDRLTKSFLKSVGGWSDDVLKKFSELGYDLDERFKYSDITQKEVRDCISKGGFIYAKIVKELPNNDPDMPLRAVDIDNDGLITVEYEGQLYQVDLKDVDKIDISVNESVNHLPGFNLGLSDFDRSRYRTVVDEIKEIRREFKLYYYEWYVEDIIWNAISLKNQEKVEEVLNNFHLTKDKMEEIEMVIEYNDDMNNTDIKFDLFCIKPYGDYTELLENGLFGKKQPANGILNNANVDLQTDPTIFESQFGLIIEFSRKIENSNVTKINYKEMKSVFSLINTLKDKYSNLEIRQGSFFTEESSGPQMVVFFNC